MWFTILDYRFARVAGRSPMWDVFISYARDDRKLAEPIRSRLTALGLSTFFDVEGGVEAGDAFPQRIADAVSSASVVLAIWTPLALSREWCRREAFMARAFGTLLPVVLKPVGASDLKEFIDASYVSLVDLGENEKHSGWSQTLGSISRRLGVAAEKADDPNEISRLRLLSDQIMREAEKVLPENLGDSQSVLGVTGAAAIWSGLRNSRDKDDLLRFAQSFPGTAEAFEARRAAIGRTPTEPVGATASIIWRRLESSDDIEDVRCFVDTFLGVSEGLEARRRLDHLTARFAAYSALQQNVRAHRLLPVDSLYRVGEEAFRNAAHDSKRLVDSIARFSLSWPQAPWQEALCETSARLERSASINLSRAEIWERARQDALGELRRSPGMPSQGGQVLASCLIMLLGLVIAPAAAIWIGTISRSIGIGAACLLILWLLILFVITYLGGAERRFENWKWQKGRLESDSEPLWDVPTVSQELATALIRYKSEHGSFAVQPSWPDEYAVLDWCLKCRDYSEAALAMLSASGWDGWSAEDYEKMSVAAADANERLEAARARNLEATTSDRGWRRH